MSVGGHKRYVFLFLVIKLKRTVIGPTRPMNIRAMITRRPRVFRLGVKSIETPTVAMADTLSKSRPSGERVGLVSAK